MTIDVQAQPSIQPVQFESTGELFIDDAPVDDSRGDEDTAPIVDSTGHHEAYVVEEENAPIQHCFFFFFFFIWLKCKAFKE